jgi:hypothetical protein
MVVSMARKVPGWAASAKGSPTAASTTLTLVQDDVGLETTDLELAAGLANGGYACSGSWPWG